MYLWLARRGCVSVMAIRLSRFRPLSSSLLTLSTVAATLAGIIGLELREVALDDVPIPIAPVRQQPEKPPVPSLGSMPSDQAAGYVAAILARPLFSPSRRPNEPAATKVADLARLTGVLVSPAGRRAIFAGPAGGKSVVVGEGGRIGEYVVSSIEVDAVTITGPVDQRILHPAFDPSLPPPKPAAVPIIPSIILGPGPATPSTRPAAAK
jgi:hypothetical protein